MIKIARVISLLPLITIGFGHSSAGESLKCTAVDYNIFPCAPYLIAGGNRTEPARECCSGFMKMMLVSASCICSMLVEAKKSGFHVNVTRVEALPEACGVPLSRVISKCQDALAPAHSPSPQSSPPSALPPQPTKSSTPTPSPAAPSGSSAATPPCLLFTVLAFLSFYILPVI